MMQTVAAFWEFYCWRCAFSSFGWGFFPSEGATGAPEYVALGFSSVFLEKEHYQCTAKSI